MVKKRFFDINALSVADIRGAIIWNHINVKTVLYHEF